LCLERVLETLKSFGFKQSDAKIYILLAKEGPHTTRDLETAVRIEKWQVYKSLRNLRKRGIVTAVLHRPALYSAIPFDRLIDLAAKAIIDKAQREEEIKEQAIQYWEVMLREDSSSEAHELQAGDEEVKNE